MADTREITPNQMNTRDFAVTMQHHLGELSVAGSPADRERIEADITALCDSNPAPFGVYMSQAREEERLREVAETNQEHIVVFRRETGME